MPSSIGSDTPGISIFGKIANTSAFKAIITGLVGGSVLLGGNQVLNTVNNPTPKTQITNGVTNVDLISYATTKLTVERPINGHTNGTMSGLSLQVDGIPKFQMYPIPCTATGGAKTGGGYYDTCAARAPFDGSGIVAGYGFDCGAAQQAFTVSGGLVQGANQVVTAARGFRNLANFSALTGSQMLSLTGSVLMRTSDTIKFGTHTVIAKTSTAPDCKGYVYAARKYP